MDSYLLINFNIGFMKIRNKLLKKGPKTGKEIYNEFIPKLLTRAA